MVKSSPNSMFAVFNELKTGHQDMTTRRNLLRGIVTTASAGLLGLGRELAAAEAPPETQRLRLVKSSSICWAPQYLAEELLRAEGFSDISYVELPGGSVSTLLAAGQADISMNFVGPNIIRLEAGDPVVFLAGIHVGCFEVFGGESVKRISDLKGKSASVTTLNGAEHVFLASIAAYVGVDPSKDITWVTHPAEESIRLFGEGKVDAIIGFPPQPQELRAKGIGRVIINSATDRPWSQYFCCLVTGSREFVRKNPVATKRALRGLLKSTDVCASAPDIAARSLIDRRFTPRYDYALQVMKELPYSKWREYDGEDTIRFYALQLRQAGMIKSSPNSIIAQGTDWRFFNELKRELKG
jgi:NitT/TauT family transport system substrate-binding protein